jgi:hypothetical protein
MNPEEKIEKIKKLITKLFNKVMTMEGKYMMPYSTNNDYANWSVIYRIDRVNIWETKKYNNCIYSGTIYLEPIEIKVGFEGDWEYMKYITDLPSWVEDDVKDSILDEIEKWLPMVCVDIDFT